MTPARQRSLINRTQKIALTTAVVGIITVVIGTGRLEHIRLRGKQRPSDFIPPPVRLTSVSLARRKCEWSQSHEVAD